MRAELFQQVVEDSLAQHLSANEFLVNLRQAGATSEEATDYVEEFAQHRVLAATPSAHANREGALGDLTERDQLGSGDSHGHQGSSNASTLPNPDLAVTEANWQLLAAKLAHTSSSSEKPVGLSSRDLLKLLGGDKLSSCDIPSIVLDGAPHLRELNAKSGRDPHLEDTWRLRALYTSTKDSIDVRGRDSHLCDPLGHLGHT